jgi:hypothetical protein
MDCKRHRRGIRARLTELGKWLAGKVMEDHFAESSFWYFS